MDSNQSQSANLKSQNVQDDRGQSISQQTTDYGLQQDQKMESTPVQVPVAGGKEQGPVGTAPIDPDQIGVEMMPHPEMPEISPELKEAGVEAVPTKPEIHPDIQKVGVTHAKESVAIDQGPQSSMHLPMTGQQAEQTMLQHKSVSDSMRWIAAIVLKLLKKGGQKSA